jgi:hypothetical protein
MAFLGNNGLGVVDSIAPVSKDVSRFTLHDGTSGTIHNEILDKNMNRHHACTRWDSTWETSKDREFRERLESGN